jgi:hypothetical protein
MPQDLRQKHTPNSFYVCKRSCVEGQVNLIHNHWTKEILQYTVVSCVQRTTN